MREGLATAGARSVPAAAPPSSASTAAAVPLAAASRALPVLAALALIFYVATATGYGYFRDELYYLACGEHLGWGYVDHPPLIGWIAAAVRGTLGDSLYALRLLPALAAAATVWLCGALARELGGGRFAQVLAALTALVAPIFLSLFTIFSMNAFDLVFWAVCFWLVARILRTGKDRLWLAFGAVAGLGLLNKISVLFLGFGLVVGLLASRRWEVFRSRWFWLGGAIAFALFLPHVAWQVAHGWPTLEFMDRARRLKMVSMPPLVFLREVSLGAGPGALPLWLGGLGFLLASRRARDVRPLGWAFLAVLVLLVATTSKPYYLAAAITLPFAAGGVAVEAWTARRGGTALRAAAVTLVVASGAVVAPLAKPLLPVESYVRYAAALGFAPGTDERQAVGRLPQFFADMHGWPELAETVSQVFDALPTADRDRACVFGQNYGHAAAVEVFGPRLGLPPAISGHNSYFLWGPGSCTGEVLLVIGDDRERVEEFFASVELGATYTCRDCMPYEAEKAIWIARGLRRPLAEAWPQVKSYI